MCNKLNVFSPTYPRFWHILRLINSYASFKFCIDSNPSVVQYLGGQKKKKRNEPFQCPFFIHPSNSAVLFYEFLPNGCQHHNNLSLKVFPQYSCVIYLGLSFVLTYKVHFSPLLRHLTHLSDRLLLYHVISTDGVLGTR